MVPPVNFKTSLLCQASLTYYFLMVSSPDKVRDFDFSFFFVRILKPICYSNSLPAWANLYFFAL